MANFKITVGEIKKLIKETIQKEIENDLLTEKKSKPSAGLTKKQKSSVVKKAKAGEDLGKPGKEFKKIEDKAKKSGAKDPKAVAGAVFWKNVKRG